MIFVTSVLRYNFLSDFDRTVEHVDFSLIHIHSTVQPQFHTVLAQTSGVIGHSPTAWAPFHWMHEITIGQNIHKLYF